jgi:Cu(I)/Ag(I) efflux system membrane fusion protein
MFADVSLGQGETHEALIIPSEALIRTGTRSTVIVAEAEGRFRPIEVRAGVQRDGMTEIIEGLDAGQKVVVSGQFLIDSEANLRGAFNKLDSAPSSLEKTP